jgi:integrase
LASCWDWATGKYHVSDENLFRSFNRRFQTTEPKQRPKPFTIAEIQKILDGFRSSAYYSGYHDFVFFLLGVGCRPGEAVGLCWQCVADDCTTVHFCRSITRGRESSTKNKKERTIDVSPAMFGIDGSGLAGDFSFD